jgi:peptidoglycan/xylan/chitin deacetylase (PgdA/CDA1 family)
MRWAIGACALAISVFAGVFGYLLASRPDLTASPPPATVAADPAPATRAVAEVPKPAPAPVVAPTPEPSSPPAPAPTRTAAAAPVAVAVSSTVAQRSDHEAFAQAPAPAYATATPPGAAPPPAAHHPAPACPGHPNALGVARTVEIDTTGGPGFGFEHFKQHDFLEPGEVVLTFDDGPWPHRTPAVLAALAEHCTKAVFFPIGKHATYEPGILKAVAAAGHSVGSHTWSHQNLAKKGMSIDDAKAEIEKGISAVAWAAGVPVAPFFRFPALRHPPELMSYLGERNIGVFSTDFDSFDFKMRRPEQVRQSVMAKLKRHGKGIILMHDFQQATAAAAMDLLNELKAGGYRVVHMRPKFAVRTIPAFDEEVRKSSKLPTVSTRPTSSVVRTVE